MNTVDCYVTKIIGEPYKAYDKWFLNVEYDAYGSISTGSIMAETKEEIDIVKVGHKYLC